MAWSEIDVCISPPPILFKALLATSSVIFRKRPESRVCIIQPVVNTAYVKASRFFSVERPAWIPWVLVEKSYKRLTEYYPTAIGITFSKKYWKKVYMHEIASLSRAVREFCQATYTLLFNANRSRLLLICSQCSRPFWRRGKHSSTVWAASNCRLRQCCNRVFLSGHIVTYQNIESWQRFEPFSSR